MIIDARTLEEGRLLEAELCIVGAGAAGLSLAAEFAAAGRDVVVLEAGGDKQTPQSQEIYEGELERDYPHPPPHMYRQRRLGGSTTIWGGRCVPFDPIDFEARDYVPLSGWPFGYEDLVPFYRRAQAYLDAGEFAYDAGEALPAEQRAFVEGFSDPDVGDQTLERFSLPTNLFKKLRDSLVAHPNVTVVSNAACLRLKTRDGRRVVGAECVTGADRSLSVVARRYVVAAGGMESVRLLFNSNDEHKAGLGNPHDVLGRYYMCHVEASIGTLRLTPAGRGVRYGFDRTRDGVYVRRKFIIGADAQRRLGMLNFSARLHHASVIDPDHGDPILSSMFLAKQFLLPEYRRKFSVLEHDSRRRSSQGAAFMASHLRNIVLGSPRLALFTADWTWRRYLVERKLPYVALHSRRGVYPLDVNGEQAPNFDSRLTLGASRDRHDQPRIRVDWRMNELDVHSVAAGLRLMRDRFDASGCGTVEFDDATLEDQVRESVPVGGHHIGGARIGATARQGVVDADLKVHDIDNLFVASAAVFPTSSHANPTLTLVALGMRLADHLKAVSAKSTPEAAFA
ncbi:MAG: GMC family oxidoreductase [Caulobacter sp.]|nr:GMC family oxidoreductase [Caulobacter sp.]